MEKKPWIETFLLSTTQHVGVGAHYEPSSQAEGLPAPEKQGCDRSGQTCQTEWLPPKTACRLRSVSTWLRRNAVDFRFSDRRPEAWVRFRGLTGLIRRVHGLYFCVASGHEDLNEGMLVGPRTLFAQRHTETETNRCCRIGSNRQWNCCLLTDWVELSFADAWSTARSNITLHN